MNVLDNYQELVHIVQTSIQISKKPSQDPVWVFVGGAHAQLVTAIPLGRTITYLQDIKHPVVQNLEQLVMLLPETL